MNKYIVTTKDNVQIEYFSKDIQSELPPFIMSMGIWEDATRGFSFVEDIADRDAIVLSYRGRGGSDSPESGYDWMEHVLDIEAVLEDYKSRTGHNKFVFGSFSKGTSYMLGYVTQSVEKVAGVLILDYPAVHIKAPEGYAEFWYGMSYQGIALRDRITKIALDGLERESTEQMFFEDMKALSCPITLWVARDTSAKIPSNIDEEALQLYKETLPSIQIVDFYNSGHMIMDDELEKAKKELATFLSKI